jgi:hypothetical protein
MLSVAIASGTAVYGAQGEKAASPLPQAPAPKVGVSAPAFPFRYGGRLEREGLPTIVALTRASQTYAISAGDMIGTSYRLEYVGSDHMTVTYLPLKQKQTIAFSSIPPDQPATVAAPPVVPAPGPPSTTILGTQTPTCC